LRLQQPELAIELAIARSRIGAEVRAAAFVLVNGCLQLPGCAGPEFLVATLELVQVLDQHSVRHGQLGADLALVGQVGDGSARSALGLVPPAIHPPGERDSPRGGGQGRQGDASEGPDLHGYTTSQRSIVPTKGIDEPANV
jgi:hypothetical protein